MRGEKRGGLGLKERFPGFPLNLEAKVGNFVSEKFLAVEMMSMRESYRAICCSSSPIFARLETFLGFGRGIRGGGVDSLCG